MAPAVCDTKRGAWARREHQEIDPSGLELNALMLCSAEGKSGSNGFPGTGYIRGGSGWFCQVQVRSKIQSVLVLLTSARSSPLRRCRGVLPSAVAEAVVVSVISTAGRILGGRGGVVVGVES